MHVTCGLYHVTEKFNPYGFKLFYVKFYEQIKQMHHPVIQHVAYNTTIVSVYYEININKHYFFIYKLMKFTNLLHTVHYDSLKVGVS